MMIRIREVLRRFRRDDEGVTLVEYGIGLTLAVTVGTLLLNTLGTEVKGEINDAAKIMQDSTPN